MAKLISLLLLACIFSCKKTSDGSSTLASSSCETANCVTTDDRGPAKPEEPASETDPSIPTLAETFDAEVRFIGMTSAQEEKMNRAIEIIKKVVATEEFKRRVLNHTYGGRRTYVDNGGFTNAEIYQKILDGAETLQPRKNNQMDLEVELYYAATSTVGYTYPNSKRVWVNTKFFNVYTPAGVARNLFHEWLHKLGFKHAALYSMSRDYSVPYAIGDLVGDLGEDYL